MSILTKTTLLSSCLIILNQIKAETSIYPKDPKWRHFRHLPLSNINKDDPNSPKIHFHKHVISTQNNDNFIYTELPIFYEYTVDREIVNNFTINLNPYTQSDALPPNIYGNKKQAKKYLNSLFNGPLFHFDIRRSTLSDSLGFEIFGLFARSVIPANSLIGSYVGYTGFGADHDYEKFTYTKKQYEYIYNGERDYIDSAEKGNFMRYVNHQDAPTVEASPIYVPKEMLWPKLKKLFNEQNGQLPKAQKIYQDWPKFLETMAFITTKQINPGEELFVDYGQNYWADKSYSKVRQLSVDSMNRHMDELTRQIDELRVENAQLSDTVEAIKDTLQSVLKGKDLELFTMMIEQVQNNHQQVQNA